MSRKYLPFTSCKRARADGIGYNSSLKAGLSGDERFNAFETGGGFPRLGQMIAIDLVYSVGPHVQGMSAAVGSGMFWAARGFAILTGLARYLQLQLAAQVSRQDGIARQARGC